MHWTLQSAWSDVLASYELMSQRKGFKRYKGPSLAKLLTDSLQQELSKGHAFSLALSSCRVPGVMCRPAMSW